MYIFKYGLNNILVIGVIPKVSRLDYAICKLLYHIHFDHDIRACAEMHLLCTQRKTDNALIMPLIIFHHSSAIKHLNHSCARPVSMMRLTSGKVSQDCRTSPLSETSLPGPLFNACIVHSLTARATGLKAKCVGDAIHAKHLPFPRALQSIRVNNIHL